jgi:hypothetical protein
VNSRDKSAILEKAKSFFVDKIIRNHVRGIKTLISPENFNINPFIQPYLAKLLCGDTTDLSIARSLIYPRVLSTSISGIFGGQMQNFCSEVLGGFGSTTLGIDIEFIDQTDKRKKYCQLKAGPNTLNSADVDTILSKFNAVKNLARTNNLKIEQGDLVVGVLYGSEAELSSHYKKIRNKHFIPVLAGDDFWLRLTGDNQFFPDLILAFQEASKEFDANSVVEDVILKLSEALKSKT